MKKKRTINIYEADAFITELEFSGVPIVNRKDVKSGKVYFVRNNDFGFSKDIIRKKNGEPDMRYKVNKYLFLGIKNES